MSGSYTQDYCLNAMHACLVERAVTPYVREGRGSLYVVVRVHRADLRAFFHDNVMLEADFLKTLDIKLGHTNRLETRIEEYGRCDGVEYVHIWIGHFEVSLRRVPLFFEADAPIYCGFTERLMHLSLFWDGAERKRGKCDCGVNHQEFVSFRSLAGLTRVKALMKNIAGDQVSMEPLDPPQPPDERCVYDLVHKS
ncbi:hypothetical protein FB45DRAFT_1037931 [Roridomyces roridus]|uniref:Uncharacterized protein n=1 Tax=Roridomyces roridus TaxID=1738132 RepID=A0AAD7FC86_9AGAR|nr:hypothetical protein FB45DRAFT_1037931 [Roridomyces roridus]